MRTDDFSSAIMSAMVRSSRLLSLLPNSFAESMDALAVADNPSHELHRRLMKRHFTRSPVADVMARVAPIIDKRVDNFIRSGGGDFAVDLASVVPVETTLALLGFPLADAPKLKRIVDGCVELLAGQFPKQKRMSSFAAGTRLFLYTRAQLELLKAHPEGATPVCAALLEALNDKVISGGLVPGLISQLIAAGVDSTASLLGNALRMLAETPELAERLRADLGLVPAFLEECLRLESPFQGHFRVVRRTTVLAGEELQPGERLMLMWGAANRDPEAFEHPDAIVLNRSRAAGSHVSFGYGYHLCLGAELARATAKYVVTRVLQGTETIALADAEPTLRRSPYLRTLTRLPLRVVAAQRPGG
jgi:cytochrome P450